MPGRMYARRPAATPTDMRNWAAREPECVAEPAVVTRETQLHGCRNGVVHDRRMPEARMIGRGAVQNEQ